MRFEDKFTYAVECVPDINIDTVEIPSMIIQPFVENAIRHGLVNLETRKGLLKIRFYKKDDLLFCEVDDNGIGMEEAQKLKAQTFIKYQSHGMDLTQQRLLLVSKMYSKDYKITIVNKTGKDNSQEGTTIIIKFPLQA
jgi:LytS/YehU family sensor histidine kinase